MLAKKAKQVLLELQKKGVLDHLILIGSWCGVFYTKYFGKKNYSPTIQTLDIDFLIPKPATLKGYQFGLPTLLKSLDFEIDFSGSGWTRFIHPELRVEFLVPRLGPKSDTPQRIPSLEINAMPLRHTHPLTTHVIQLELDGIKIILPHPLAFALHKLFVSSRRKEPEKALRDREMAYRILDTQKLINKTKDNQNIWNSFSKKEKREIHQVISQLEETPLKNYLLTEVVLL